MHYYAYYVLYNLLFGIIINITAVSIVSFSFESLIVINGIHFIITGINNKIILINKNSALLFLFPESYTHNEALINLLL